MRPMLIGNRTAAALAVAAAAVVSSSSAAAAALPTCAPDARGAWSGAGAAPVWVVPAGAPVCAFAAADRASLLDALAGASVCFVGDSIARMLFYEALLWGWGCVGEGAAANFSADAALAAAFFAVAPASLGGRAWPDLAALCAYVADAGRWSKLTVDNVVRVVMPAGASPSRRDVRMQFRWARYVWEARDAALACLRGDDGPAADVAVVNSGLWHLKNSPEVQPFSARWCGLEPGLANLTAEVRAAGLAGRVVWRGLNALATSEASTDFNNPTIVDVNAATAALAAAGGVAAFDFARFTPPDDARFYEADLFHPARFVMRAALPPLVQAVLDVRAGAGRGPAAAGAGAGARAAEPGTGVASGRDVRGGSADGGGGGGAAREGSAVPAASDAAVRGGTAPASTLASAAVGDAAAALRAVAAHRAAPRPDAGWAAGAAAFATACVLVGAGAVLMLRRCARKSRHAAAGGVAPPVRGARAARGSALDSE